MSEENFTPPTPTQQASFDAGVLRVLKNVVGALYKASPPHIREALIVQLAHDFQNPPEEWTAPEEIEAFSLPLHAIESVISAVDQAELEHRR